MDHDGNKNIYPADFLKGLRTFGLELTDEEGQELFEKFDTGNGNVNVHEFLAHVGVW